LTAKRPFRKIRRTSVITLLSATRKFFVLVIFLAALSVHALTIIPTFDATITNDVNASTIENTINSAIQLYQARFSNPITVSIQFKEISTSGL
jgi:hypothetical protein